MLLIAASLPTSLDYEKLAEGMGPDCSAEGVKQHIRSLKKRAEAAAAEPDKDAEATEGSDDVPATPKATLAKGTKSGARKKAAPKAKAADNGDAAPKRKRGRPAAKAKPVAEDNKENEGDEPESPAKIAKTDAAPAAEEA
ncbi:hypothetical protein N7474_005993 [Penicillium riverlandense]|uniref:uncharacterized protein n=1 Tax=Penicillium riverlandense TaxID=1903569 RepID=UPI0025476F25|nr:uncharacterized protein N7474_005993 [Penicillium riverlandense]KAJ5820402.1 hypothetical protein N7474_005993 [Penicillium riverlandense]